LIAPVVKLNREIGSLRHPNRAALTAIDILMNQ
jgi:hypothetical protein